MDKKMVSNLVVSTKLNKAYDVMLKHVAEAHIHWDYTCQIYTLLKRQECSGNQCLYFFIDTHTAHQYYMAQCLMKLYDKGPKPLSISNFLKELKSELVTVNHIDTQNHINLINGDLKKLNNETFNKILNTLSEIRNEKYSHIDRKNATGQWPLDSYKYSLEITEQDIIFLLSTARDIISQYEKLFSKEFKLYLHNSTITGDILKSLELEFFS